MLCSCEMWGVVCSDCLSGLTAVVMRCSPLADICILQRNTPDANTCSAYGVMPKRHERVRLCLVKRVHNSATGPERARWHGDSLAKRATSGKRGDERANGAERPW